MSSVNGSVGKALFHEGMLSFEEFTPQLELTCEAYGHPPPDVIWLNNGLVLHNITGRRVITVEDIGSLGELGNFTRSTLSLSEVQLSDAGEYTCRATSGNVSPILGTTAWIFMFQVTGGLLIIFMWFWDTNASRKFLSMSHVSLKQSLCIYSTTNLLFNVY